MSLYYLINAGECPPNFDLDLDIIEERTHFKMSLVDTALASTTTVYPFVYISHGSTTQTISLIDQASTTQTSSLIEQASTTTEYPYVYISHGNETQTISIAKPNLTSSKNLATRKGLTMLGIIVWALLFVDSMFLGTV